MLAPSWRQHVHGGLVLGVGAAVLLLSTGYVAGFTSILAGAFNPRSPEFRWKVAWLLSIVAVGAVVSGSRPIPSSRDSARVALGCFLLGLGAMTANGCTSGHGLMGLGRGSLRSLVAVGIFFATAVATASALSPIADGDAACGSNGSRSFVALALLVGTGAILTPPRPPGDGSERHAELAVVAACAALFAVGLVGSGMHDPATVNRTLNLAHPRHGFGLCLTLGAGVAVVFAAYHLRPASPLLCQPDARTCRYETPTSVDVPPALVAGSALFGVGWGLSGVCPSTIPLRLGMGDHGLAWALPAFGLGAFAATGARRVASVRSRSERIVLHAFFEPTSSSFTYVVGSAETREVLVVDSVRHPENEGIPSTGTVGDWGWCEHVPREVALERFLTARGYAVRGIVNTHVHVDHVSANQHLKRALGAPTWLPRYEGGMADHELHEGVRWRLGDDVRVEALRTPGHTSNCHSLLVHHNGDLVFCATGDCLLPTTVGRTDLNPGENAETRRARRVQLHASVQKLAAALSDETVIGPAHAYGTRKLLVWADVRARNAFVGRDERAFAEALRQREEALPAFHPATLELCTSTNLLCGATTEEEYDDLQRLFWRSSGSCG